MVDQDTILSALRTVKDPELNLNVVDLGLVYSIQQHEDGQLDVEMTLTTPACPAGPEILRNAVAALESLEGVSKANVRLVMSPPWTPDRMSDAARDELGIFRHPPAVPRTPRMPRPGCAHASSRSACCRRAARNVVNSNHCLRLSAARC
jgi:metal-sulfur cluster biosynthetic enzyme